MDGRKKILFIAGISLVILVFVGMIIYGLSTSNNRKQTTAEEKLIKSLPYENDEYKIEYNGEGVGGTFTISLYAILNGDNQLTQYNLDLKTYKTDALQWIGSQGVSVDKINIIWLPEEAGKL